MKKKNKSNTETQAQSTFWTTRLSEGGFILLSALALFVLIALVTYPVNMPQTGRSASFFPVSFFMGTRFASGSFGIFLAHALYLSLGYMAYFLAFSVIYFGFIWFTSLRHQQKLAWMDLLLRSANLLLVMLSGCGLFYLLVDSSLLLNLSGSGGLLGRSVTDSLTHVFGLAGTLLFLFAVCLTGLTGLTGISWFKLTEWTGFMTLWLVHKMMKILFNCAQWVMSLFGIISRRTAQTLFVQKLPLTRKQTPLLFEKKKESKLAPQPFSTIKDHVASSVPAQQGGNAPASRPVPEKKRAVSGSLPALSLLDKGVPGKPLGGYTHQELEILSREVEQYLLDFGIQADVVAVHPGPVITRFELQLAAGVKVSRLSGLAKDLARSLSVISVRVVEVIPGKTVVGLELPNQQREMVCLSQVLESDVYQQAHSPLALALGVDIAGHPMIVDLAKMPHLLVAGTTGSGKSVGINAMILSLLFKSTPEQVRLIMIDPKMLELSVYEGIPHLLTPVVTDMKEAASALRWCVGEMERRYRLMAAVGVRNLAGYNTKVTEAATAGQPMPDPLWKPTDSMAQEAPLLESLPYIVVVIDELADMMMVVGKKVEQLIARIAQKARAAGIHLVLATQRPSVDVLTGLIKSNIPTRISFQVSSKIDSRTILDQQGAESLLGHGDMLFLAPGTGAPLRVHGAFVDDQEVHRVADDWRARGEPAYIEEITQVSSDLEGGGNEDGEAVEEADALYDQAVEFVVQSRKASISAVQRRFKIGYNRSARLVEEMERVGIVGPLEGGMRDVLVSVHAED